MTIHLKLFANTGQILRTFSCIQLQFFETHIISIKHAHLIYLFTIYFCKNLLCKQHSTETCEHYKLQNQYYTLVLEIVYSLPRVVLKVPYPWLPVFALQCLSSGMKIKFYSA